MRNYKPCKNCGRAIRSANAHRRMDLTGGYRDGGFSCASSRETTNDVAPNGQIYVCAA